MKKIYIPLIALVALFVSGCWWPGIGGSGHIVTDKRPVAEFSDIKAGGMFEIDWHPGASSLSITTDDNLLSHIENRIEGKTLRLDTRDQIRPTRRIKVLVTSPNLTGVSISGAVRLNATELSGPRFYLDTSGACHIVLSGNVDDLVADMSGATKLEAKELHTKNADISSSGASKAEVSATETLRVSISGAGKVTYFGHPKVERHISGAGSINPGD
ncbi:MAG: hypothetical protein QOI22_1762 [Verrucomicrobiota bacterium]